MIVCPRCSTHPDPRSPLCLHRQRTLLLFEARLRFRAWMIKYSIGVLGTLYLKPCPEDLTLLTWDIFHSMYPVWAPKVVSLEDLRCVFFRQKKINSVYCPPRHNQTLPSQKTSSKISTPPSTWQLRTSHSVAPKDSDKGVDVALQTSYKLVVYLCSRQNEISHTHSMSTDLPVLSRLKIFGLVHHLVRKIILTMSQPHAPCLHQLHPTD